MGHDAATERGNGDVGAHEAVFDGVGAAPGKAHKAAGVVTALCGVGLNNRASHLEVLDGGSVDVTERCGTCLVALDAYGEGMVIAVESAHERILLGTHHGSNTNIFHQLDVIKKYMTIIHMQGKLIPSHFRAGVGHGTDDLVGGDRDNFFDGDVVNVSGAAIVA